MQEPRGQVWLAARGRARGWGCPRPASAVAWSGRLCASEPDMLRASTTSAWVQPGAPAERARRDRGARAVSGPVVRGHPVRAVLGG